MPIKVNIIDPATSTETVVRNDGGLAVSPAKPSKAYNATLDIANTAVNIVPARGDERFYITGILLTSNKNVSNVTDAVVDIYEASDFTTSTVDTNILTVAVAQSARIFLTNLYLETDYGKFINGKTTDDDVLVTIFGYYIPNHKP